MERLVGQLFWIWIIGGAIGFALLDREAASALVIGLGIAFIVVHWYWKKNPNP